MKHILLINFGSKHSLVMKFSQFMHTKENFLSKNSMENISLNSKRILCKKKSKEICMLIWTNFDSFAIAYLI